VITTVRTVRLRPPVRALGPGTARAGRGRVQINAPKWSLLEPRLSFFERGLCRGAIRWRVMRVSKRPLSGPRVYLKPSLVGWTIETFVFLKAECPKQRIS